MIIELGKYNEIGELLMGNRTTGLQAPVTKAAVHMGVEETGMQTGHRGAYSWPPSQE